MKDFENGIDHFKNAIDLDSTNAKYHYNLGKCYDDFKVHSEAQKCYAKAYELDSSLFEDM